MASNFMENLWNSIFTPGTTPTLLVATNASFLALQLILGVLLIATYSVHFFVLSALCAGLWWSINWFATELKKAEKAEEEAGRLRRRRSGLAEERLERETDDGEDEAEEETETETEVEGDKGRIYQKVHIRGGPQKIQAVLDSANLGQEGSSTGAQAADDVDDSGAMFKRRSLGDNGESGSVSTDSEWEKVSDR
jgi:ER protein Pkr1